MINLLYHAASPRSEWKVDKRCSFDGCATSVSDMPEDGFSESRTNSENSMASFFTAKTSIEEGTLATSRSSTSTLSLLLADCCDETVVVSNLDSFQPTKGQKKSDILKTRLRNIEEWFEGRKRLRSQRPSALTSEKSKASQTKTSAGISNQILYATSHLAIGEFRGKIEIQSYLVEKNLLLERRNQRRQNSEVESITKTAGCIDDQKLKCTIREEKDECYFVRQGAETIIKEGSDKCFRDQEQDSSTDKELRNSTLSPSDILGSIGETQLQCTSSESANLQDLLNCSDCNICSTTSSAREVTSNNPAWYSNITWLHIEKTIYAAIESYDSEQPIWI